MDMEGTVTISRAEYESLQHLQKQLHEAILRESAVTDALAMAKGQIATLHDLVAQLQRRMFGRASERFVDTLGNQPDLPGLDQVLAQLGSPAPTAPPTSTVQEHERKKRDIRNKGKFTLAIPDSLPREEFVIDVPEN